MFMNTNGKSRLGILCAVVVLLFAALAVGLGIKLSRPDRADSEPRVEQQQIKPKETRPQEESKPSKLTAEDEEFLQWLQEKMQESEDQEEEETETMPDEEGPVDMAEAEPAEDEVQEPRRFGGWRDVWANLNLTEEEKARLREGIRLAVERWQNMTPEEREAETARLQEMGERWENMSDDERREASERMRDRFEEWRQSDDVELPELSLD
jgi:hypothetical protein